MKMNILSYLARAKSSSPVIALQRCYLSQRFLCELCGKGFFTWPPAMFFWLREWDEEKFPVCADCASREPVANQLDFNGGQG
jgi:hypothetical protein